MIGGRGTLRQRERGSPSPKPPSLPQRAFTGEESEHAASPPLLAASVIQREKLRPRTARHSGQRFSPLMRKLSCRGPTTQRESRKKSHQPSEPGREGDPRYAGAPQSARISPAKREDARRLPPAASGSRGIRHTTGTPFATRTRGSTGVVGGVEGPAPLTPCPPPRRRPSLDAGQQPRASGRKKREPISPEAPRRWAKPLSKEKKQQDAPSDIACACPRAQCT